MNDRTDSIRVLSPRVSVSLPPEWMGRTSLELFSADLRAQVEVRIDDVGPDETLERYAEAYGALLAERAPCYEELHRETFDLGDGRQALARRFSWKEEAGGMMEQLHLYVVQPPQALTATVSSLLPLAEIESKVKELVGGIRLERAGSGVGLVRFADDPRSRTYEALERGALATPRTDGQPDDREYAAAWQAARTAWKAAGSK